MPRKNNRVPHILPSRWEALYDRQWMEELKAHSAFYKLTYRILECAKIGGTFYDVLIRKGEAL